MKKNLTFILIILLLIIASTKTINVSAAGNDNVYLFNPSSACTVDDYLFIADNVDDYNSKIHIFDRRTNNVIRYSMDFNFQITKIRATKDLLFILHKVEGQGDDLVVYEYRNFAVGEIAELHTNVVDFDANSETFVIVTPSRLQSYNSSTYTRIVNRNLTNVRSVALSISNNIYYILDNMLNMLEPSGNDADFTPIPVSSSGKICGYGFGYYLYHDIIANGQSQQIDIYIANSRAYVTNYAERSVNKYHFINSLIDMSTPEFSIGDSGLDIPIPFVIGNLFAPDEIKIISGISNDSSIIYTPRTIDNDNYKLSGTLLTSKRAIVLGEVSDYYLILLDGKIGYIEKEQAKAIDTIKLNNTPVTKYIQHDKTTIYSVPYINNSIDRAESKLIYEKYQLVNLTNAVNIEVSVYASFFYDKNNISLISFVNENNETVKGYVLTGDLKDSIFVNNDREYEFRIANPPAWNQLLIYNNSNGSDLLNNTIRSGVIVRMYEQRGEYSYIECEIGNITIRGWVESNQLIVSGMTNNGRLGLIITIGLILLSALIVILVIRHKRKSKDDNDLTFIDTSTNIEFK